jgi:hypothetical protein
MQVGTVPDDWGCYRRAEMMPVGGNCTVAGRATLIADSSNGAADAATEAAAALATAAVLLGPKDPAFAKKALNTAHSLYDYASQYPVRSAEDHDFHSGCLRSLMLLSLLCTCNIRLQTAVWTS